MICQKCKVREATVIITKTINDIKITMHLCPECSKSFNPGLQKQISGVNNILMKIMGTGNPLNTEADLNNIVCSQCGMSFSDFRKKGVLGCGKCYDEFRTRMQSILKRLHGSYRHIGQAYEGVKKETPDTDNDNDTKKHSQKEEEIKEDAKEDINIKIQNLKKALNQAVEKEEYEEAAKLRDMIKIMEDKAGGSDI